METAMTVSVETPAPATRPRLLVLLAHRRLWVSVRAFCAMFAIWWLLSLWNDNPLQLPSPPQVFDAWLDLLREGELFDNAWVSTVRMLVALGLSIVVAIPLGFVMGLSRRAEQFIDPVVEILRPISGIAWLPLALFIFGVGNTLPVFIMFYVGFFPILLNTVSGVRQTDPKLLAAARTMGVRRVPLLVHVLAPSALPTAMVGIRQAFAASWAAIVAAELIGAPSGLGFAIEWYRELLMSPKVFAFILTIGIVGYICDLGLRRLQSILTPWTEGTGASS